MTIRRTLLATQAAAALIAPAAQAQPADMHTFDPSAASAQAQQQPKQDLRSPDAREASQSPRESGGGVNAPGATAVDSATRPPTAAPAGQPTWPVNPTPLAAPAQEAATDDGSPVPVLPLVAGVLVVLAAALMARYGARRVSRRTRIAA